MSQKTALVVDDSSTARLLLSKVLRNIGITCRDAVSGEDALRQLATFKPHFIFLDHIMPGIDGFETLKKIKENPETRHIPVVMYTSQNALQYYKEAHHLGAVGVISKQIDREKLYLMLDRLCLHEPQESEITELEISSSNIENQADDTQDEIRKLTGRLSTVETAYEELYEEFRNFKQEAINKQKTNTSLMKPQSGLFSPAGIRTICITIALFIGVAAWLELGQVETIISHFDNRINIMHDLLTEIIELLDKRVSP